jgi:hypothetical protein
VGRTQDRWADVIGRFGSLGGRVGGGELGDTSANMVISWLGSARVFTITSFAPDWLRNREGGDG